MVKLVEIENTKTRHCFKKKYNQITAFKIEVFINMTKKKKNNNEIMVIITTHTHKWKPLWNGFVVSKNFRISQKIVGMFGVASYKLKSDNHMFNFQNTISKSKRLKLT